MTVPFFSPLYRRIIAFWDPKVPAKLRPLWEHPCGEYDTVSEPPAPRAPRLPREQRTAAPASPAAASRAQDSVSDEIPPSAACCNLSQSSLRVSDRLPLVLPALSQHAGGIMQ